MIQFGFPEKSRDGRFRVLCLGAHSDDIEIGCGGTILSLKEARPDIELAWVVFSAAGVRGDEARHGAKLFAGHDRWPGLMLRDFRDGYMPFEAAPVKDCFEELKATVQPDVVFTHNNLDAHQDHRLISELTWNTFRDHLILEYEIPKYDGDLGRPNLFVPLTEQQRQRKVANLMEAFQSQRAKRWFQPETFHAIMRLRGMECNAPSGYAEAFYCRKAALQLPAMPGPKLRGQEELS